MGYVGNEPTSNFASVTKDLFSGDGSTTAFTLSKAATTNGVAVFVENVRQEPTIAYAVSGTTLTFTAAPVTSSGNNIYVLHHNAVASTANHPASQDLTAVKGTFTGNVTGAGMDHLLSATISSAVSAYDISSTYINSTYDNYFITAEFLPATDNTYLHLRTFVGGSVRTDNHGREVASLAASSYLNDNSSDRLTITSYYQNGNATGEGITINANLQNVNNTARPCCVSGMSNNFYTNGSHASSAFAGSIVVADASQVVNGLRFYMSSGDIASGSVKLYGLKN